MFLITYKGTFKMCKIFKLIIIASSLLASVEALSAEVIKKVDINTQKKEVITKSSGTTLDNQHVNLIPDTGEGDSSPSSNEFIQFGLNAKDSITPETTGLLGEQIDLNTGALSFTYTDVSLPGNNNIPVSISRQFKDSAFSFWAKGGFGDWALDIPHIRTKVIIGHKMLGTWGRGQECSGEPEVTQMVASGGVFLGSEYFDGEHLHVPGMVSEQLLYVGGTHPKKTKSNWRVTCAPNTLGAGEMYIVQSPNGLTYTFNVKVIETDRILTNGSGSIGVKNIYLYVSKIQDRFNNTVNYHYGNVQAGPNTYKVLNQISSSDGRLITLRYDLASPNNRLITSVNANGRQWFYSYQGGDVKTLASVRRPDNSEWRFNFSAFNHYKRLETRCSIPSRYPQTVSITHPNGVKGTFTVEARLRGKTKVHKLYNAYKNIYYTKKCHQSMALTTKTISGPGLPISNWSYSYSENLGYYANEASSGSNFRISSPYPADYINNIDYKRTTVLAPDGSKTMYYHNRDYTSVLDGKLVVTEYYDTNATNLLKRVVNTYQQGPFVGDSLVENVNVAPITYRALMTKKTIELHQGSVNKRYYKVFSEHNDYGVARKTYEYNNFNNNKRYTKQGYYHDTTNYLLNLPTTTYVSSDNNYVGNELVSQQTYHSASGGYKSKPYHSYRLGRWVKRNESYHTSGTNAGLPKLTRLNASNRWSEASDYYRGIPRTIRTPQSTSTTSQYGYRTVDSNGWIKQTTDFNGNVINYGHDNLGRKTLINPASAQWNNTTISYNSAHGSEESSFVHNGMLIKTTTKGNFESKVYYNGLLRPVLTKVRDKRDSSTIVYTRNTYNAYGKKTFQSQPKRSITTTYGTNITYDGLGRITKSVNNALGGNGVRYSYAPNSKVSVTDNRNLLTTTTYKAYGSPSQQEPISIVTPNNLANTIMTYSLYGNLKSITQGGISEHRVYDYYHNLCKTVRPDIGNTAVSIDAVGNTVWSAQGNSVSSSLTACDTSVSIGEKTTYSYNNLGALSLVSFGDSTANKAYFYDKNGNLKSLSFNGATHNYNYNDLNLMTSESLVFDGYIWTLTHQYNAEANKNSITYPSGRTIYYSPNALGQAQSVGSYASNIDYFENGQLKNMTHGNSCLTIQTLKSFGVPNIQRTSCGGSSLVNNQYSYDGNFNITRWNDLQNTSHDLKFTYDALDRLDTTKKYVISSGGSETQFQAESVPATSIAIGGDYPPPTPPYPGPGPVGSWNVIGDMNYDNMGNITTFRFGGSYINYYYGSDKKLSSTSGSVNYNMAYDSRGNVTSNGNKSFSYNLANQMTYGNGNSYRYDGHNRRVKAIDSTGTRYSFYTSSGQLVFENINGVSQENYYLGSQLVAQQKASVVTYIHRDLLGSTAAKSNSLGNMVSQHRYKPFGQDWGGTKNEIGYTGHKFDTDLGLSYMQARYYDPVIGRFYSNDPVGYTAKNPVMSFNRYMYVNNNPYKYTDPDGKLLLQAVGFVIGVVQAGQAVHDSNASFGEKALAIAVGGFIGAATGGGATTLIAGTVAKMAGSKVIQTAVQMTAGAVTGTISGAAGQLSADLYTNQDMTMDKTGLAAVKGFIAGVTGGAPATTGVAVATTLFTETVLQASEALASESPENYPVDRKENE